MAKEKQIAEIYLTSGLENVRGGSVGFTLEAIWFGYTSQYAYTGSSAPNTGWLPSYPLKDGLEFKAQLPRVAAKTVAKELAAAEILGYHIPHSFDGKTYPSKVCVESSSWFMEMLMDTA
jgi:hypothetical protein